MYILIKESVPLGFAMVAAAHATFLLPAFQRNAVSFRQEILFGASIVSKAVLRTGVDVG
jgi:hypothetical protein